MVLLPPPVCPPICSFCAEFFASPSSIARSHDGMCVKKMEQRNKMGEKSVGRESSHTIRHAAFGGDESESASDDGSAAVVDILLTHGSVITSRRLPPPSSRPARWRGVQRLRYHPLVRLLADGRAALLVPSDLFIGFWPRALAPA